MSKRSGFEFAGQIIEAGTRRTLNLPVPDLYTSTGLSIPVHIIHGNKEGPVLFLSGAIHGDEINGVEIIRRVLGSKKLSRLSGTLIAAPVVNIFGFLNQERYLPDRRDLNRVFPGSETGSLASRMAHLFIKEIVSKCTHGIDLHTAAVNRENFPQVRAILDNPVAEKMSRDFGLPVILNTKVIEKSLREAAQNLGVNMILYEAGEALRFDELSIRGGVKGILSVMEGLTMLPKRKSRKTPIEPYVAKSSSWVRAPQSGIHRVISALGSRVKQGEILGYISDPLGETETEVLASASGLIIGRATVPLITEGEALFHIARFDEPDREVAELVDEAQQALTDDTLVPEEPPIV